MIKISSATKEWKINFPVDSDRHRFRTDSNNVPTVIYFLKYGFHVGAPYYNTGGLIIVEV